MSPIPTSPSYGSRGAELYPAYRANIHERRIAAVVARAVPLTLFVGTLIVCTCAVFRAPSLLLFVCAVLNTSLWLYLVTTALFGIVGARKVWQLTAEHEQRERPPPEVEPEVEPIETGTVEAYRAAGATLEGGSSSRRDSAEGADALVHLVVYPNYKEDEAMLEQTLLSLSEAEGSESFRVVLAMEEREGKDGVRKAKALTSKHKHRFKWLEASFHPKNLREDHLDGSSDAEVPGKASNLKYAVNYGYEACRKEGLLNLDRIVLTVADADCLFHPGYFSFISQDYTSKEFNEMRASLGSKHIHTMWQAPQLPFRNFFQSPVVSRAWGYIAAVDELGGVTSLAYGGHHMVFSAYSVPLRLAVDAQPWDGDVVAEDHHAYLRCLLYSAHAGTLDMMTGRSERVGPLLRVRPVFLPVKSTSVACEGYWQSWIERYHQARRHMQGVSEFSYALLATYDHLCAAPPGQQSLEVLVRLFRALAKLFCMHVLPEIQGVALGILTLYWYANHRHVPQCPDRISLAGPRRETLLCGLAGAWILVWPVVVPVLLIIVANYLFMSGSFVGPGTQSAGKKRKRSIWALQDGGCPPTLGSVRLTVFIMIAVEGALGLLVLAVPYCFVPGFLAYVYTCFWGNRIEYVTAAKMADYGSVGERDPKESKLV